MRIVDSSIDETSIPSLDNFLTTSLLSSLHLMKIIFVLVINLDRIVLTTSYDVRNTVNQYECEPTVMEKMVNTSST